MGFLNDVVNRVKNSFAKLPTTAEKQQAVNQQITRDSGGSNFLNTLGQGLNNWIVAPAAQIPLRMREATKARREGRMGDWGMNMLQAVGGAIPGIDDAAWAGINAIKNKAAGGSFKEGLAGNEFAGIGDVGKRYGLDENTANTLNTLELPLLLLGGGIRAKNVAKNADKAASAAKNTAKTSDILQSLTEDALAKNLIPDELTIKSTKDLIESGADITQIARHFDEQLGFQPGKAHEMQINKNAGRTVDQIKAQDDAEIDALLKRGQPQTKPPISNESPLVQDILNDRYTGPDVETTFPKPKDQILEGVTTEKPTALVQSPKLPKGAVISKDGTRYTYKGRSYPLLTGNEKSSVNLTSDELAKANPIGEKLGFSTVKTPQELVNMGRKAGKTDDQLIQELTEAGVDISGVDLVEGASQTTKNILNDEEVLQAITGDTKTADILNPKDFDQDLDDIYTEQIGKANDAEPPIPATPPELVKPKNTGEFIDEMTAGYEQRKFSKAADSYTYDPIADFGDFGTKIKPQLANLTPEKKSVVLENTFTHITDIANRAAADGITFGKLVDDIESGIVDTPSHRALKQLFDTFKDYSVAGGAKVGSIKDYFTHLTKESIDNIMLDFNAKPSMGDIWAKPYFSMKRTGSLVDYEKTPQAVMAYVKEALKNTGLKPIDQIYIDAAKEIATQVQNGGKPNYVELLRKANEKAGIKPEAIYAIEAQAGKAEPGLRTKFTQTLLSEASKTDDKFWTTFILPFREATTNVAKQVETIIKDSGMTEAAKRKEISSIYAREFTIAGNKFAEAMKKYEPGDNYTRFLINEIGDTFIGDTQRQMKLADKISNWARQQANRGYLGFNVYSAINNSFETSRIAAAVSNGSAAKATKLAAQGVDKLTEYGIKDAGFTSSEGVGLVPTWNKTWDKIDKGLFYLFDKTEKTKNNYALLAFEQEGIKRGLKGTQLKEYVLKNFDRYAIAFGKGNDLFAVKSPLAKTVMQYLSYSLRDTGILIDEIKNKNTQFAIKKGLGIAAQIGVMGLLTGSINPGSAISPLGLGQNIFQGKLGGPIVQGLIKLWNYGQADDKAIGEQSGDYESEKAKRAATDFVSAMVIPGYNQLFNKAGVQAFTNKIPGMVIPGAEKFLDEIYPQGTWQTQKRGYKSTYTGNVAYPAPTNPWTVAQSTVFGESGSPEAKEYFRAVKAGEYPSLNKKESEVFKKLPKEEQKTLYNQLKSKDVDTSKDKKLTSELLKAKEAGETNVIADPEKLTVKYLNDKDYLTEVFLGEIPFPEFTNNETVDKALASEHKSALRAQIKGIIDLYQLKKISLEEATVLMQSAENALAKYDNLADSNAAAKSSAKKRTTAGYSLLDKASKAPTKSRSSKIQIKTLKLPKNRTNTKKVVLKPFQRI